MSTFKRLTATLTALAVLSTSMPLPAQAGVVGTQEAIAASAPVQQTVRELLVRQEVRDALIARGVDPAQVEARIAALTPEEARLLADRLDRLPAGGAEVLGILFAIFVILLVTDILGLTRVFPFTRPIR